MTMLRRLTNTPLTIAGPDGREYKACALGQTEWAELWDMMTPLIVRLGARSIEALMKEGAGEASVTRARERLQEDKDYPFGSSAMAHPDAIRFRLYFALRTHQPKITIEEANAVAALYDVRSLRRFLMDLDMMNEPDEDEELTARLVKALPQLTVAQAEALTAVENWPRVRAFLQEIAPDPTPAPTATAQTSGPNP